MNVRSELSGVREVYSGVPAAMSKRYRFDNGTLAVVVAVFLFSLVVAFLAGSYHGRNEYAAHSQDAGNPGERFGDNAQWIPNPMRGTFSYETEPELAEGAPTHHEYYDLRAQERVAQATDWIAWLTAATAFLSACGLFALFVSLAQTRKAIADTREIGEAQTRGYLALESGQGVLKTKRNAVNLHHGFDLTFRNSGITPLMAEFHESVLQVTGPKGEATTFFFKPAEVKKEFGGQAIDKAFFVSCEPTAMVDFGAENVGAEYLAELDISVTTTDVFKRCSKLRLLVSFKLIHDGESQDVVSRMHDLQVETVERHLNNEK